MTPEEELQRHAAAVNRSGRWQWVILACAFIQQALSLGLIYSMGIFFTYWLDEFQESKSLTAWIGSVNIGIMFGLGPVASVLINRFSHRVVAFIGSVMSGMGLFAGAFVESVYVLYVTFGVISGAGLCCVCVPSVSILGEYFFKRRQLAIALSMVGAGLGSLIFPPLLNALITFYGWRGGLMITAGITLQSCVTTALLRPVKFWLPCSQRISHSSTNKTEKLFNLSLLKEPPFMIFFISTVIFYIGVLIPMVLLTDYALLQGITPSESAWLLSSIGIFSTIGRLVSVVVIKILRSDRVLPCMAIVFILHGLTIIMYLINTAFWAMLLSSMLYGLTSGIYGAMFPVVTLELSGVKRLTSGFGYMMLACGIGALVGPPFQGWLFDVTGSYTIPFYVGGSAVIFAGSMMLTIPVFKKCTKRKYHIDNEIAT